MQDKHVNVIVCVPTDAAIPIRCRFLLYYIIKYYEREFFFVYKLPFFTVSMILLHFSVLFLSALYCQAGTNGFKSMEQQQDMHGASVYKSAIVLAGQSSL